MASLFVSIVAVVVLAIANCARASALHHPDINAARHNAFALFNSIHSAMRQWGSSVNHNGMSFYLTQAPRGSIFYHGGYTATRPVSFEWLAFEVEHAANFAQSWEGFPRLRSDTSNFEASDAASFDDLLLWHQYSRFGALHRSAEAPHSVDNFQPVQQHLTSHVQEEGQDGDDEPLPGNPPDIERKFRGYFHTYRANRPLNLIYVDGEGAAKCPLGTLDSQDLILLGWNHTPGTSGEQMQAEFKRAKGLCSLADEWSLSDGQKIDGFIRMEAGFEIIYCDFSLTGGLDLTSVQASPFKNESHLHKDMFSLRSPRWFEWLRASANRFHGHPTGRLDVDWSSLVSAFAYPVNLSNPDVSRQDIPRLLNATEAGRNGIRSRLRHVLSERLGNQASRKHIVDWQGTVDNIVTRYSQRLEYVTQHELTAQNLLVIISTLIDPFINYLDHSSLAEPSAVSRCTQHYLQPLSRRSDGWTPEDHAISVAVETVSGAICASLFTMRRLLLDNLAKADDDQTVVDQARDIAMELVDKLKWSTWRECGACTAEEICSIPMFPVGGVDDYFHPTCKNRTQLHGDYFGHFH